MDCPICDSTTKVLDKRNSEHKSTRRRRECLRCGYRFSTYEMSVKDYVEFKEQ